MQALPIMAMLAVAGGFALGQSSASYNVSDHAFNEGGRPETGTILASASYRISLDAIGDGARGEGLGSASYRLDGSFVTGYSPPGEVIDLKLLPDHQTLEWSPEWSVGVYNVYRGLALPDPSWGGPTPGYGNGFDCDIDPWTNGETTQDTWVPSPGSGGYYLVTAENRLGEEGTMGSTGSGDERRPTTPCP